MKTINPGNVLIAFTLGVLVTAFMAVNDRHWMPEAAGEVTRTFGGGASITPTSPAQYTDRATAEWAGATSATQCPTRAAKLVRIKARSDNAGSVYIGYVSGTTTPNGTTDTTTGFELTAGQDTGWIPCSNTDEFYRICANAGDDCTVMILN